MLKVEHTHNISVVRDVDSEELIAEFFGPDKVVNADTYIKFKNFPHDQYQDVPQHNGHQVVPVPEPGGIVGDVPLPSPYEQIYGETNAEPVAPLTPEPENE